jgi:phenylpropionate dioxygenase-like ring-hydroxylating dioxygenase large terminal subunit
MSLDTQLDASSLMKRKEAHAIWYAVALSTEVTGTEPVGVSFFDGRLALYRTPSGSVVALDSRCPHMGADLARGDIVDDQLRCMFHHFRFGPDGHCTAIPSGGRIPASARVRSFPCSERWGLVWVFNGDEPSDPPPGIRDYNDDGLLVRSRRTDVFPVEPWVIMINFFDFQHLRYVHNLNFDFDESTIRWYDQRVEYDITFILPDGLVSAQRNRLTGTNTVSWVTSGEVDSMGMFTSTPTSAGSQSYYVAATPGGVDENGEERLQLQERIADEFLKDDTRAFAGMRFHEGALVAEDRSIVRYLSYVKNYPTSKLPG